MSANIVLQVNRSYTHHINNITDEKSLLDLIVLELFFEKISEA